MNRYPLFRALIGLWLAALLLSACEQSAAAPATPMPSTSTPPGTPAPLVNLPAPKPVGAITLQNAGQVFELARWDSATEVQQVVYAPDGKRLAMASAFGVGVYDAETLAEVWFVAQGPVRVMAFSPDGQTVLSAGDDGRVQLWASADGRLLRVAQESQSGVGLVSFAPDGKTFAVARYDCGGCTLAVSLYTTSDAKLLRILSKADQPSIASIAFSTDGQTLVGLGYDGKVTSWRTYDGAPLPTLPTQDPANLIIRMAALSADGQMMALVLQDGSGYAVQLRRVSDGSLLRSLNGSEGQIAALAFSSDGRSLAGASSQAMFLWDTTNGTLRRTIKTFARRVALSPDGKTVFTGRQLWRVADGTLLRQRPDFRTAEGVALSPDGNVLAVGLTLWRIEDGSLLRALPLRESRGQSRSVAFSPDGKLLASASAGNGTGGLFAPPSSDTVQVWNLATGSLVRTLRGHKAAVNSVVFSPDGQLLASGSADGTVRLWRLTDGELLRTLEQEDHVESIAFAPDGKIIAGVGKQIKLWQTDDGKLLRTIDNTQNNAVGVAFAPDGQTLATGSADNNIQFWRIGDGALLRMTVPRSSAANRLAFSPDGQLLVSIDGSQHQLWRVADGALLRSLDEQGQSQSAQGMTFSADGKVLVTWSGDNSLKFWGVPAAQAIPASAARATATTQAIATRTAQPLATQAAQAAQATATMRAAEAATAAQATATMRAAQTAVMRAAQATATAQPVLATVRAAAQGRVVLFDNFSADSGTWPQNVNVTTEDGTQTQTIRDGKYYWEVKAVKVVAARIYPTVHLLEPASSDFYFALDARNVSGPASAYYGILLRQDYRFIVNDAQQFWFELWDGQAWRTVSGRNSSAIHPAQVNHLAVYVTGSHFTFVINGQDVVEYNDPRVTSGQPGLTIELGAGQAAVVEFDNIEIRAPLK